MSKSKIKNCTSCAASRLKRNENPRPLYEVPGFSGPTLLCYYCDGDAYKIVTRKGQKK